jgi:hypothetical protein
MLDRELKVLLSSQMVIFAESIDVIDQWLESQAWDPLVQRTNCRKYLSLQSYMYKREIPKGVDQLFDIVKNHYISKNIKISENELTTLENEIIQLFKPSLPKGDDDLIKLAISKIKVRVVELKTELDLAVS